MPSAEAWPHRFWRHVDKSGSCWLWTGGVSKYGYGHFYKSRLVPSRAHRVSWELTHGDLADDACVLHKCDVRRCVNPEHLFLGTKTDNMRDRDQKNRNAKGERINNAKLTAAQVLAIRARHSSRRGVAASLMREFGIGSSALWAIVNHQTWKHLKGLG